MLKKGVSIHICVKSIMHYAESPPPGFFNEKYVQINSIYLKYIKKCNHFWSI